MQSIPPHHRAGRCGGQATENAVTRAISFFSRGINGKAFFDANAGTLV
jgi:hypothetical protein